MQLTAELRWSRHVTVSFPVVSARSTWAPAPPEEREDLYLYSPECEYLVSNSGRGGWKSNGVRQN